MSDSEELRKRARELAKRIAYAEAPLLAEVDQFAGALTSLCEQIEALGERGGFCVNHVGSATLIRKLIDGARLLLLYSSCVLEADELRQLAKATSRLRDEIDESLLDYIDLLSGK